MLIPALLCRNYNLSDCVIDRKWVGCLIFCRQCKQVCVLFAVFPSPCQTKASRARGSTVIVDNLWGRQGHESYRAEEVRRGGGSAGKTWRKGGVQMTSFFIGEFCEVRKLRSGRDERTPAGIRKAFFCH